MDFGKIRNVYDKTDTVIKFFCWKFTNNLIFIKNALIAKKLNSITQLVQGSTQQQQQQRRAVARKTTTGALVEKKEKNRRTRKCEVITSFHYITGGIFFPKTARSFKVIFL